MCWAKEMADPYSGTRARAEKGHWSQAVLEASTMSAMPGNQAAPPPTAGPLRARMRTFLWSIIERRSSAAGHGIMGLVPYND